MDRTSEFLEFLELQDEPTMITKSELVDWVRSRGGKISDRLLTFYASSGLIPKAVRVGSRAGAYPTVVADLLIWVVRAREIGLSVDAIREQIPVWKFLRRSSRHGRLDLVEFEYVVKQHVKSAEAVYALPTLLFTLCPDCFSEITLVLKDGTEIDLAKKPQMASIGFFVQERDVHGELVPGGFTRVVLPIMAKDPADDPSTLLLETTLEDSSEEESVTESSTPINS